MKTSFLALSLCAFLSMTAEAEAHAVTSPSFAPGSSGTTSPNGGTAPAFSTLDANRDGVLESTEVQTLFLKHPQLFKRFDTNNDGIIDSTEAGSIPAQ